ncbi:2-C-methyl-D-erythritol 4-phosphate cytidylyltransferase [Mucilaginibacter pedocola]|uniref:2-C-methyl-D-erythritol 4-phosphate cytidylyltransferase n=1 Tax=Mucilaginibacter pedocola TaxID=1792845 RepID=A0A1S9P7B4_9SPHI|nr:2-C-methyl-D-erythritol 4-phosphate cytidylyltransferase [Mucilaginibacter pedocola]OOQ56850.1 2-C-methyl-D-erythritol 4-phosphate cytidylyltransferase [Mucilaginibacter pedocola]
MPGLKSHISDLKSKSFAIIVAGGTGSRMQSALPKQFLELNGKPVLMHTLEAFAASTSAPTLILVLHADFHGLWKELCAVHNFSVKHLLLAGGETRFHSVKNAIDYITDTDVLIAVHDAVRPLISPVVIDEAYSTAQAQGSAVVAVKSRDSVRQTTGTTSQALNRDSIYLVQTPQTFQSGLLKQAYKQPYTSNFTDDASVVEQLGHDIQLVEGNHTNIKITFPEDIAIAEAILNKKPSA